MRRSRIALVVAVVVAIAAAVGVGIAVTRPDKVAAPDPAKTLDLPRVPWDGGAQYWAKFPKATAAGWTDPSFFPVVLWYGTPTSKEQLTFDKSYGLNTYAQGNPDASQYAAIKSAGMFTLFPAVGQPSDADQTQQVGTLVDDEVDGRYETAAGLTYMKGLAVKYDSATTGRFTYANWTSGVVTYDRPMSFSTDYYDTVDVNSLDQYFYSVPQCDGDPSGLRWRTPATGAASTAQKKATPITTSNCRTSSSYGKVITLQQEINAARKVQAPIWAVTETVGIGYKNPGLPDGQQVQGEVMSSLIHEARGILWFSQSFDNDTWNAGNPCVSGDSYATMRTDPQYACAAAMGGVKKISLLVKKLAPVLNTQSFVWSFGTDIDSMLKVRDGSAYIFAMTTDGGTGSRTFALPENVAGTTVEVVGESRSIAVEGGKFTDTFAAESSYHVYKITL